MPGKQEFSMPLSEQEYTDIMGACLWAHGRYSWSALDEYLVELETAPKHHIVLTRKQAIALYKECRKEFEDKHYYPCASEWLVDIFEEIWDHFDPYGEWAFL